MEKSSITRKRKEEKASRNNAAQRDNRTSVCDLKIVYKEANIYDSFFPVASLRRVFYYYIQKRVQFEAGKEIFARCTLWYIERKFL
jgi:hypothetical protein